jgi:hypothetical protein
MPGAEKEALTIEPWAAGIGLATLALVASVALFTAWDRAHTAALEAVITPTAVGDTHYVRGPAGRSGPIGLKYQGRNLDVVLESKVRDSRLIRVGTDDSGVYSLYRPEDEKEALLKDRFFMKVGPNQFIEVTEE